MKLLKVLSCCLLASVLAFGTAFVGIGNVEVDAPGTIEVIGDAGSPQTFVFNKWQFTKASIPDGKVENIQAEIEINISSLSTGWKELEKNVKKKKDYFYVKKFPKAKVTIDKATALGDGRYQTEAMLSLKKHTKPVLLTFTISDEAPYEVEGEGVIMRRKWGFNGNGPKNEVPVKFKAVLPIE
ncbi:MAG: YceI family protein [Bacteroidota bacterium]